MTLQNLLTLSPQDEKDIIKLSAEVISDSNNTGDGVAVRNDRRSKTVYEVQETDAQNSDTSGDDARKQESEKKGDAQR